jgi:ubiquinone/menaquinone biosynthesis C-methylase UbiE
MQVVCSDLDEPTLNAKQLHAKYDVTQNITYADVNCLNIPYQDNTFDIVAFKSVMGGIGHHGNKESVQQAIKEMHRVLKPGGILLFAENTEGSCVHKFLRKNFVRWGKSWFYLSIPCMKELLSTYFPDFHIYSYGFWGCMLKDNVIVNILDKISCKTKLSENHYMCYGYAVK